MIFLYSDKLTDNPLNLMRKLGYHPARNNDSFIRRLGQENFPRFHIYLKNKEKGLEFSLHLDQKGVCYSGQTAHSGDYNDSTVVTEKERILNLLAR